MHVNWEETSWGSKYVWEKDASECDCPILSQYGEEIPRSARKMAEILYFCRNKCGLFTEPFDAWECCPYGQQMAKEVQ